MFGFHSFSENPFSSLSAVSAGEVKTGVATLNASGNFDSNITVIHGVLATLPASGSLTSNASIIAPGSSLLLDAGTVTANGTLLTPIASSLEASGELSSEVSLIRSSEATIIGSGTISSNGTALVPLNSSIESSGELTSDIHVVHGGISELAASGTLGVNESVELNGTSLLLDAGTVSAKGTLLSVSTSSTEASGIITADPSLIIPHDSSLSGSGIVTGISSSRKVSATDISSSGTTTNNGTLILGPLYSIESSGTVDPNGSNLIAGKASLTSPGVTIVAGTFNPGELTASLSASSSITAQIGLDLESQATVGNTAKEFIKKTSRPNYKPALPKLSNKDIVVDFPFHEGAGNLRSVSSRRQTGNIGNLSWGRVDGRQSLTSTGTFYSNNRISFDTAGVSLTRSTIVISFKPTSISSNHFLFNLRGTANNNNEIDCYIRSNQKINIDIYNGTSKQTITTAVVNLNEWNTLVLTWDNNLKAYLNGSDPVTLGSFVEPAVLGSTFYIAGRTEDNFGFIGSIDHFRLYNKQISDIEAKQLHKNIYKDYSLDYIIPNHYEMTRVTSAGRLMKKFRKQYICIWSGNKSRIVYTCSIKSSIWWIG